LSQASQTLEGFASLQGDERPTTRTSRSEVLDYLAKWQQRAQKERQLHQEMQWLAENRHRYSGRWIALEGGRLLAVGDTSREVFSKVANCTEPPLVIRIEEEELPFAGW